MFMTDLYSILGTPIYIGGVPGIVQEFKVSITLAIAPASLYVYGLGLGALLATSAAEIFGRRIVYRVTVLLSLIFTIVSGASKNYNTLASTKALAGLFSGLCLAIGVGVANDLWDLSLEKMGTAFAVFYALFIMYATMMGPMASGAIITYHLW